MSHELEISRQIDRYVLRLELWLRQGHRPSPEQLGRIRAYLRECEQRGAEFAT